jgi:uncharacterized protein
MSVATPFEALLARQQAGGTARDAVLGYGPLAAVRDEATGLPLLQLPASFRYISYGWTGDPLEGDGRTPAAHDGMAAFAGQGTRVRLVRNHEVTTGPAFAPRHTYDEAAGGGTVTLEFDTSRGAWIGARASLSGTIRNCAGGPTPWGSWLTCEETLLEPGRDRPFKKEHGYIFEVPVDREPSREPLEAMGRFVHEAIAVDPKTGAVYETEDSGNAGVYRFTPEEPGDLDEGGRLEMLAVAGRPQFDTRVGQSANVEYPITWVPIKDPDRAHRDAAMADGSGVFSQGWAEGGAVFARLEGAWYSAGKIYVTATSGGAAKMGQVWEIDPNRSVLRLVYESPGAEMLNMPDNLCASPRGGLVLCEDGTANPSMHGLSIDGRIFRFARNNMLLNGETRGLTGDFREGEFAGATFSPDGHWLFVNIQSPGVTFAITGPWANGLL